MLVLVIASLGYILPIHINPFFHAKTEALAKDFTPPEDRLLAPDFSLYDLNGNLVSLSDFRGSAVFLGYWTTW